MGDHESNGRYESEKHDLSIDEDIYGYNKILNALYARFDNHDFREETRKEVEKIMKGLGSHTEYVVSENDVSCVFRRVNVRKCGGSDGLKGWIFKHCALQLSSIYEIYVSLVYT